MSITPAMIKELREMTGSGMSDCKKALEETGGDVQKAVALLREKGLAAAAKKAGRIAAEGVVALKVAEDHSQAVIVEVNCETDFVAINPDFKAYVEEIADQLAASKVTTVEDFLEEPWSKGGGTVAEVLQGKIATVGENLKIRRVERIVKAAPGIITSYVHGGGKIGVLLEVHTESTNPLVQEMAYNICMQIAALFPRYLKSEEVDQDYINEERQILTAAAKNDESNAGKPENVIENMVEGRLKKQLKEVCLLEQDFVKDNKLSVKAYVESIAKEVGSPITLAKFVCFEKGASIEKKQDDFAEEVAKAMQG